MIPVESSLESIADYFLDFPCNASTEHMFERAVWNYVADLYTEGGYILDRLGQPILNFENVELIIDRGKRSISVTAIKETQ